MPFPADRLTERIVVGLSVFIMVVIKRCFFPTKVANPDSNVGIRMAYLFIAIAGTIFLALALLGIFADLQEYSEPVVIETLLGFGIVLLLIATFIDRKWLKLRENT